MNPIKVGQTVKYRWHTGRGNAISPARVEIRSGWVTRIQGERVMIAGARGWVPLSRIVTEEDEQALNGRMFDYFFG